MQKRKRGGPALRIERPDVQPCHACLPDEPGLVRGAMYECTCATCNGLGILLANGDPVPVDQANDLLARLVIAQRRHIWLLEREVARLNGESRFISSPFD